MMIIKTHKDVVTPLTNDPADFKGLRAKQPRFFYWLWRKLDKIQRLIAFIMPSKNGILVADSYMYQSMNQ